MLALLTIPAFASALTVTAPAPAQPPPAAELRREVAAAIGYSLLQRVAGVRMRGTFVEGDATGTLDATLALPSGYSKTIEQTGQIAVTSGFDGATWQSQDGVVTVDDLPGDVADSATSAWLGRDGEADPSDGATVSTPRRASLAGVACDVATFVPAGGSPVELWFDARTHLLAHAVFFTDGGTLTTDYSRYASIDGIAVALEEHDVDATGASDDTTLASVTFEPHLDPRALARSVPEDRARLRGTAVVPFVSDAENMDGHIVVPVSLDGHPVTVDFDSGGTNALTPDAATRIGLATSGGLEVGGVGNASERATTARVKRLAIGSAEIDDQPFLVLPLPYAVVHPRAGVRIDGLVGFEFLSNFRTRIDYADHTIAFSRFEDPAPRPPDAVVLPFSSDGHTPYVEAEIDGVRGLFEIDTGANATVTIFDAFAKRHGLFTDGGVAYSSPGGVGGEVSEQVARAKSFTLAGVRFDAPVVAISKTTSGAFASRSIAGNIGSAILSRYTLTFDYRARTIAFEPRAKLARVASSDRTGFGVAQTKPGELSILSVAQHSPAALAGLRPGDRIVALDGVATDARTLARLFTLRDGDRGFALTIRRGGRHFVSQVVPADVLGAPQ